MPDLKEQWGRVLRFRDRYVEALAHVPNELLSMIEIPPDRQREIGQWSMDLRDFGIACCQQLHHVKDWVVCDPTTGVDKETAEAVVAGRRSLLVIADLCNGTKHAELTRPRSKVVDPGGLGRKIRLSGERDADGHMVAAAQHLVIDAYGQTPLIEVINDGVEAWTELFMAHGIGAYGKEPSSAKA